MSGGEARSKRSARSCARMSSRRRCACGRVQHRQVDAAPARHGVRHDDLHGPAEARMAEAGAQAGVALHESTCGPRQARRRRARPSRLEHQLDRVDVGRLRVIVRMEQQPLLQGRQRQDVVDARILPLELVDLALGERAPAAGRSACGRPHRAVRHGGPEPPAPGTSPVPGRAPRSSERSEGAQVQVALSSGPSARIERECIDLDGVRQRQRRIAAAERHRLRARPRSPSLRRAPRSAPQIVEADLRRRQAAQARRRSAG